MNSKRGKKNVIFGLTYQLLVFTFGLITPRLLIVSYGSAVNGLLSSVSQIYAYLALLEAGVGTATLQALYRTIAADDKKGTCSIMSATHHFYKKTGTVYFICVVLLSVLYPIVIETEISNWVVVSVIFLNGLSGVINYFFQGKYRILLQAEGKSYILSNISSVVYVLSNIAKILLVYYGYDVLAVQLAYFLINLLPLCYIAFYISRRYKWLDLSVKPDFAAISQKNSVIIHQLSGLIFSNTDVILLTVFSDLKTVSVYSLYASFYGTVKSVLLSFLDGIKFAMGQIFHKSFTEYIKLHDAFELFYMALTFAAYTVLQLFMIAFLQLYTKGITDINYIDEYLVYLFSAIYLLQAARGPSALVIDFAEHFKQTKNRAILEMGINIVVSVVGIISIGIYGVLIGTIVALLYRTNDMIIYANRRILKRSPWVTYRRWLLFFVIFILFVYFGRFIIHNITSYPMLLMIAVPVAIVVLVVYIAVAAVSEPRVFKNLIVFIKK